MLPNTSLIQEQQYIAFAIYVRSPLGSTNCLQVLREESKPV